MDIAGVAIAADEAADRIELCTRLDLGGLTASRDLFQESLCGAARLLQVHPLVRCRPGDFVYSAGEISTMARQIATFVTEGAAGVVFGALTCEGAIDGDGMTRLIDSAREANPQVEITCHRAIDQCRDPLSALLELAELGVSRVMSSGGAKTAGAGRVTLAAMHRIADGRLEIMAGGGLKIADIPALKTAGVNAVSSRPDGRAGDPPPRTGAWSEQPVRHQPERAILRRSPD
ncbi:copper homeostasis protein CutC [Arthrobacter sp. FB24]|uniref:copper homeostasis protein CutC n=1 Tax=Arthrobacter sp. (strain FB24) TaxID=290399 RepID=UPI0018DBF4C3|nr:copper homeostasis protein CutC [Arthrobacter sp. FB24]